MTIQIQDIYPLTDFQRNAKAHLARVNRTGRAEVLTVNGKASGVLIGNRAYTKLLAALEELATFKSIQSGLEDLDANRTVSAAEVHARLTHS